MSFAQDAVTAVIRGRGFRSPMKVSFAPDSDASSVAQCSSRNHRDSGCQWSHGGQSFSYASSSPRPRLARASERPRIPESKLASENNMNRDTGTDSESESESESSESKPEPPSETTQNLTCQRSSVPTADLEGARERSHPSGRQLRRSNTSTSGCDTVAAPFYTNSTSSCSEAPSQAQASLPGSIHNPRLLGWLVGHGGLSRADLPSRRWGEEPGDRRRGRSSSPDHRRSTNSYDRPSRRSSSIQAVQVQSQVASGPKLVACRFYEGPGVVEVGILAPFRVVDSDPWSAMSELEFRWQIRYAPVKCRDRMRDKLIEYSAPGPRKVFCHFAKSLNPRHAHAVVKRHFRCASCSG